MYKYYLFLSLLFFTNVIKAQEPKNVALTFNKTVHLIFPKDIYYFDVGSEDILVEQKNAILKLASKTDTFEQTNLTVVTIDNVWYTFLLNYEDDIKVLTYFIDPSDGKKVTGAMVKSSDAPAAEKIDKSNITKNQVSDTAYNSVCSQIISKSPSYLDVAAYSKKIYLALNNIFIYNEKLYFIISVGNSSNISYDINFIQLSVVNKTKLKLSSIQEENKTPLFVYNKIQKLPANTKSYIMIFVYDKFTIPDDQKLVFEMYEKKGGRKIAFDIKNDLIINALPVK
jgi:conjugative transposon TraN protein